MRKAEDLTGRKFGRLTPISLAQSRGGKGGARWNCRCDCGKQTVTRADAMRIGKSRSCGCITSEMAATKCYRHGMSETPTYSTWEHMVDRCRNPKFKHYAYYGGRGITVCERWLKFENFYADMGERPASMTLDRINVNGNYEPGNCRWATRSQQQYNRRPRNRMGASAGSADSPSQLPIP